MPIAEVAAAGWARGSGALGLFGGGLMGQQGAGGDTCITGIEGFPGSVALGRT